MGIKNYATGQIPYLKEYIPYTIPTTQVVCDFIADMVSVNLQPRELPTNITYYVGAESTYNFTMTVKNLTLNTTLQVTLPFSDHIFSIEGSRVLPSSIGGPNRTFVDFMLNPQEQRQIQITLNKSGLNSDSNYDIFELNLPLTIKNIVNGMLTVKESSVQLLNPTYLPQDIVVK
jgi:hypothetical protein